MFDSNISVFIFEIRISFDVEYGIVESIPLVACRNLIFVRNHHLGYLIEIISMFPIRVDLEGNILILAMFVRIAIGSTGKQVTVLYYKSYTLLHSPLCLCYEHS